MRMMAMMRMMMVMMMVTMFSHQVIFLKSSSRSLNCIEVPGSARPVFFQSLSGVFRLKHGVKQGDRRRRVVNNHIERTEVRTCLQSPIRLLPGTSGRLAADRSIITHHRSKKTECLNIAGNNPPLPKRRIICRVEAKVGCCPDTAGGLGGQSGVVVGCYCCSRCHSVFGNSQRCHLQSDRKNS